MQKKKRILLFIDSIGYGGAQKQFVCLCQYLKERGYDVTIMVVYDEFDFYKPFVKDVEIICDTKAKKPLLRLFRIPYLIIKQRPDVVIAYLDNQAILACLARFFSGFKLIVSERNTTQRLNWHERLKFFLYRKATYIVPNSYTQGRFISSHFPGLKSKIKVITNVIDESTFYPSSERNRHDPVEIISVGRKLNQKNYLGMVDTVKILKDRGANVHFTWYAGDCDLNYTKALSEKIERAGISDIISVLDPTTEIADKYRRSDFFWLASFYEGFPNVLCEAMMCGLPVACSNVCDNGDVVKEKENGFLFDPYDSLMMASKIEKLLQLNDDEIKKMSENNVNRIKALCTKDSFINKYIEIIEK